MPRTIWLFPVLGLKRRACLSLLRVLGWRSRILSSFPEQVFGGGHYDPPITGVSGLDARGRSAQGGGDPDLCGEG